MQSKKNVSGRVHFLEESRLIVVLRSQQTLHCRRTERVSRSLGSGPIIQEDKSSVSQMLRNPAKQSTKAARQSF